MKKLFILILLSSYLLSYSQCPRIKSIMIDACGTNEERNEFMVLTTPIAITVNNLKIDFDANNNTGGATNLDINGVNCSWRIPRASSIDSLKKYSTNNFRIIPANPGGTIPANSIILVLTSDLETFPYDISNLTYYGNVYVLQSSCVRVQGAFTNLGNGANYRITKINYNSCRDSVWHYIGNTNFNGDYGIRNTNDTMRKSNGTIKTDGCNDFEVLPIELYKFYAECLDNKREIYFSTLSEINVDYFYLQKSKDAINWIDFAWFQGSKLSTNLKEYYSYDESSDKNYYRIMEVDLDGSVTYSKIIYSNCRNKEDIWFTQSNNFLYFYNQDKYELYNMLGQLIKVINEQEFNINHLSTGFYLLKYDDKIVKIYKN